jgi:hypothetical protein
LDSKRCEFAAQQWRDKAIAFAQAVFDDKIVTTQNCFGPKNRKDYPHSLMEGSAGMICFLSDLLRDESERMFPGYEV